MPGETKVARADSRVAAGRSPTAGGSDKGVSAEDRARASGAILFDVDGTLVDTGGAGRRSLEGAARRLFGRSDLFDEIHFDGMTDRSIGHAGLARLGRPWGDDDVDRLIEEYLVLLEEEVARSDRYRVLPGVVPLLEALESAGARVGLGTGNVEAGARVKLARGGLNRFFAFGGFGDVEEERGAILRAGVERARRATGEAALRVWVLGDTPKDLAAAREIGASCVLVATGRFDVSRLAALGPELCVETLEDPRVLGRLFDAA